MRIVVYFKKRSYISRIIDNLRVNGVCFSSFHNIYQYHDTMIGVNIKERRLGSWQ